MHREVSLHLDGHILGPFTVPADGPETVEMTPVREKFLYMRVQVADGVTDWDAAVREAEHGLIDLGHYMIGETDDAPAWRRSVAEQMARVLGLEPPA